MPTTARSVAMALAMLRGVHLALGARSETGELAGDGATLAAGAGQGEATAACPQSLPELDALMEKLTPIYDLERRRMATAVKAAGLAAKYAGTAEKLRREAAELDAWLKQHPVADKWKRWQKPAPTCTPSVHEWDAPDCSDDPLTKEQELALAWQSRARARKRNEAEHKKFKLKEELFRQNETKAYALATAAMDTVGSQLVDGALGVCGKRLAPFMEDAGARIPKMPEAFEVEQAGEALKQLDAVWASVAGLKDCLPAKWKAGGDGGACFEAVSG
mmetsp:Transcript_82357/g.233556  ORF Transcript_82357/g.233556 Transcript_82357/m.233556 type:complete len:275 (+) Transcript_82357:73-897(+)